MSGPYKILLIEDSPEDRQFFHDLLAEVDFADASTASQGLDLALTTHFDCVLADNGLPDGTGLRLIAEVRRQAGASAPPMILLTGSETDTIGPEALQAGAMDVLPKSDISASWLRRSIRHARERWSLNLEREKMQSSLQRSLERLRLAQEGAEIAFWDWGCDGEVVQVSENYHRLFGTEPGTTILFSHFMNRIHPDDRSRVGAVVREAVASRGSCDVEFRIVRPDGTVRWLAARGSIVFEGNGMRHFVGANWDVTVRKQAEQELATLAEQTKVFAYALAHDLRSPIRGIATFSEILASEFGPGASVRAQDALGYLQSSASRMDQLIRSLERYVRAGDEERDAPASPVAMRDAVLDVIANLHAEVERAGAAITYSDLPIVLCPRMPLIRVLQNLIENAIKYAAPGSAPRIRIDSAAGRGEVTISVEDNGQGFDEVHAEQLFQPFQRLHGSRVAGSGLGLATCRRVVSGWGGRIWAESQPGKGSRFSFTIPDGLVVQVEHAGEHQG